MLSMQNARMKITPREKGDAAPVSLSVLSLRKNGGLNSRLKIEQNL